MSSSGSIILASRWLRPFACILAEENATITLRWGLPVALDVCFGAYAADLAGIGAGAVGEGRCSCTALRKATRHISQLYDAALAPSGLKTTQRAILAQISRSEPTTVGNLAEALVMDSGALAHTLKPLARDGFIAVKVDPGDRRSRLINLTRQGRTKLAETDALWDRAQASFEAAFGQARSDALRKAMTFLISDGFTASFEQSLAGDHSR